MLTSKQEKFVQNLVKGMSQREAYKHSYNAVNMKDKTIDNKASNLFKKDNVRARYNELIKKVVSKAEEKTIMNATERMEFLTGIIKGTQKEKVIYYVDGEEQEGEREADMNTKIKSIDILNKMDNSYQQNINVKGTLSNPYSNLTEDELRKLADDS